MSQPVPGALRRRLLLAGATFAAGALTFTGVELIPGHAGHAPPPGPSLGAGAAGVAVSNAALSSTARVAALASQLGFVPAASSGWIAVENARTGTSAWRLTKPARSGQIEGFANRVSIQPGEAIDLYVSTLSPTFRLDAYRMGYYGGSMGRLVWSTGRLRGVTQPACPVSASTNTVECSWSDPVAVATTAWVPGDYLFKLTSSMGWESYVPLTVRDDASRSAYLLNNSVATWEAYNLFGGYDLYSGQAGDGQSGLSKRSRIVSFDRPYILGDGSGDFVPLELPMVATMESLGLDVSYTTDADISDQPQTLLRHRALITLGHDEYWTLSMRQGVIAARDAGVNLVFLGANAAYRHIRLTGSPLGHDRQEIDYKDAQADPLLGKNNADVTPWAWRDWPNDAPESLVLGETWACNPVHADMVITDATQWLFDGANLENGTHIPGVVGPEYDHFDFNSPNPGNVTVVASSPVICAGRQDSADMTYYSAPSGAGVWDTGTIDWVESLSPVCSACASPGPTTKITLNVLASFGEGPAGKGHPSVANAGPVGESQTSTTVRSSNSGF